VLLEGSEFNFLGYFARAAFGSEKSQKKFSPGLLSKFLFFLLAFFMIILIRSVSK
jgi:hypothetical protein